MNSTLALFASIGLWSLALFNSIPVFAQTFNVVSTFSGTQSVSGINVTVVNSTGIYNQPTCGAGPWFANSVSNVKFKFSSPVQKIRSHFEAVEKWDSVQIKINGQPYSLTTANLSPYAGPCNLSDTNIVTYNGLLTGLICGTQDEVQVDIQPGYGIDSVEVNLVSALCAGVFFDFAFAISCSGHVAVGTADDSLCVGDAIQLSTINTGLSNNCTYSWSGPNGFTSTQQSPVISNAGVAAQGSYTVTVSDSGLCVYTDSKVITVSPYPMPPTISSVGPICVGDTLHLSGSSVTSGVVYSWNGPNNFNSGNATTFLPNVIAIDSGYYRLGAIYNGCGSFDSVFVNVKLRPAMPIVTVNTPVCTGDSLKLQLLNATSAVTYSWTGPGSFTSSLPSPSIANAQPANAGSYIVTAVAQGCSIFNSLSVVIDTAVYIITQPVSDTICQGGSQVFSVSAGGTGASYQWQVDTGSGMTNISNGSAYSGANSNQLHISSVPLAMNGYAYRCVVSGICGATVNSNAVTMGVQSSFSVSNVANGPTVFCAGDTVALQSNTNYSNYQWQRNGVNIPGATASSYKAYLSGQYNVIASISACSISSASVSILVHPVASDSMVVGGRPVICSNIGSLDIGAVVAPGQVYQWYRNGVIILGATASHYAATNAGSYNVMISDSFACSIFTTPVLVDYVAAPSPIIAGVDTVLSTGSYSTYQWSLNGNAIAGANGQVYTAHQNGSYNVTVTDSNGCSGSAAMPYAINGLYVKGVAGGSGIRIRIYPNPARQTIRIAFRDAKRNVSLRVYDIIGQLVYSAEAIDGDNDIDVSEWANGVYVCKIPLQEGESLAKFIVNH